MGFRLPDLIVESVIRDGLANLRQDTSIIDDLFSDLVQSWNSKKYGDKEINRIKNLVRTKEIHFVQAFAHVPVSLPCISLQLLVDDENLSVTHLDDFEEDVQREHTDPSDIANEIIVSAISATSYDSLTGIIALDDGTTLTNVHPHQLFVDASGNEYEILPGINEETGSKSIRIAKDQEEVDLLGPCQIRSSINFEQYELRGTSDQVKLLLGIHTEDRLLTIYLYTMIKYILKSRTLDLVRRGFQLPTFSGSDFTRNTNYTEPVFERFLTVSGMVQDSWNSDQVIPIEDVVVEARVQRDEATNEQLDREEQTVQVDDDELQED